MANTRRQALIIGINKYLHGPVLRGCVNDARLMSTILQRQCGFQPDEIQTLLDEGATGLAIKHALDQIAEAAGAETSVFLFFSGWGARLPRAPAHSAAPLVTPWDSASFQSGPAVGSHVSDSVYDSALLPHDWLYDSAESMVRYDDLRTWLSRVRSRRITIVLDAPYSGTLLDEARASTGIVYLGASRTDEICFEFITEDGVIHGGLTYFLSQVLLRANPDTTFRQLFEQISAQVASRLKHQHPQLEGDCEQPVFGREGWPRSTVVAVTARNEAEITLSVGAAAGVTLRSWWAIYPEAALDTTDAEKLGMAEITRVNVSDAKARILSEVKENVIGGGASAVEVAHDYGAMRLRVGIDGSAAIDAAHQVERLKSVLAKVELLQVVEPSERGDVIVRFAPEGTPIETDPSGQRVHCEWDVWLIEDDAGSSNDGRARLARPIMRPSAVSDPYAVRLDLEKLSRYRNVLSLMNPNLRSPLAGKVDLIVKRKINDDEWVLVEASAKTGLPVLHAGDHIRLEIRNDHERAIYASVFDFGLSMTISSITDSSYSYDARKIEPRSTVSVPSLDKDGYDELALYFPVGVSGPSGTETLKLFATTYPMDLSSMLLQEGGRTVRAQPQGATTELWQLMDMAITGRGTRERRPVQLPPEQEWVTVQRAFELRRGAR
ncbi:caspase family protein [Sorangium sp. KYC3313]|uniref:caspase family protein n=1 Tax=Sorangium sp. KYC3313 TaxID=3449740 RepID=UPI003F8AA05F